MFILTKKEWEELITYCVKLLENINQLKSKYNQQPKDISEAIKFLLKKEIKETEQKSRTKIGYKLNK